MTLRIFGGDARALQRIDFNRDVRPIFNQSCVSCHGGVKQSANVSFLYREEALGKGKSGRPTIVPGHPERSELIARITSTDPDTRMPYHSPPLPKQQTLLLRQWIKEGAQWQDYWAFVPPKPLPPPAVKRVDWPKQPLDAFVLDRLEREGLQPAPEATRSELLRRVSLDLTGLPPTPMELSAFLADTSANAYERQVDRLLASPHYGERWASLWLDLARYADSGGYESDGNRPMWPYRDWVVEAFNRNLPYNRFVITQLAGDLLPESSFEDQIATAFQRLTPVNNEGGTDDEEFRLAAVMDRVATTWLVLNGITMNCVQCHSHPYDPIRHAEYYKFLAFYNTSRDGDLPDDSPVLRVPVDSLRRNEAAQLQRERLQLRKEVVAAGRVRVEQATWQPLAITTGTASDALGLERYLERMRHADFAADKKKRVIAGTEADLAHARNTTHPIQLKIVNGEAEAVGTIPARVVYELVTSGVPSILTALRIDVPPLDPGKARHSPENGFVVDSVEAWIVSPNGQEQKIKFGNFVADAEENLPTTVVPILPTNLPPESSLVIRPGGFAANSKLFRPRWLVAIAAEPLQVEPGSHLKLQLTHTYDFLDSPAVVRRVRIRTSSDRTWSSWANESGVERKEARLAELDQHLSAIPSLPLPVMAEEPAGDQRETLEFERGNFLNQVGPALVPDTPALLPKLPQKAARDRLTMAQWFFSPQQPLTARVAVNRFWEELFGTGLVETLENFGSAGELPSHPALLDWLALHFQNDLRWDMKALLRELVTSATYRQSARMTPAQLEKDPRNRLLARGPQQRLTAEMVRDQALLASGLLTPTVGGPSVMPPQPAGVWMTVLNNSQWIDAQGPNRYRRAIYTFLKRSAIYPSFLTFDASARDVSLARRIPTNTPLQALVTLNDPVYQEAAQALGRRMLAFDVRSASGAEDGLDARLNYGARCVLSRDLVPAEMDIMKATYHDIARMTPTRWDVAAWTAVATLMLNLDSALVR